VTVKAPVRHCAVYTRKSSEEGLEQDFNSLHAQREACEAFIRSQRGEGWRLIETAYDDGGLSGGTLERPALQRLFADIAQHRVDTVVVYKVDRLTRSLMDFAKMAQTRGKLDLPVADIGDQALKNIVQPVRVFRVGASRSGAGKTQALQPMLDPPVLPLPDKPSIAVLPFQNMSGDPEQEYFADGMVEEIITAL
jgi:hypothetical protein